MLIHHRLYQVVGIASILHKGDSKRTMVGFFLDLHLLAQHYTRKIDLNILKGHIFLTLIALRKRNLIQ